MGTTDANNNEKKNITIINMNPPYRMEASTLVMASSHRTASVKQLLVCEKEILIKDLIESSPKDRLEEVDDDDDDDDENNQTSTNSVEEKGDGVDGKKKDETLIVEKGNETADENEDDVENIRKRFGGEPIALDSLGEIFGNSHTVILPDSMFHDKSRIYYSEVFLNQANGLDHLLQFYKKGGTVIVMCLEGFLFSIDDKLNTMFGTEWKAQFSEIGSCSVAPTVSGELILGQFAPKEPMLKENPHFITCKNKHEGLYAPVLQTKEQFAASFRAQDEVFERLGIEEDTTMDCFNLEKSWENYQKRYTDCYAIAIHEDTTGDEKDGGKQPAQKGGSIVWYGDRGQSETMAFVFCKMLNLDPQQKFGLSSSSPSLPLFLEPNKSSTTIQSLSSSSTTTTPRSSIFGNLEEVIDRYVDVIDANGGGWTVFITFLVVLVAISIQLFLQIVSFSSSRSAATSSS